MGIKKTKTTTRKKIPLTKMASDIWPIKRDVFFRPARMKYVRRLIKPTGCVFCISAKKNESEKTLCIYKTKHSQIVVNKFPYNSGHVLVLPLRHIGDVLNLSEAEFTDLHLTLKLAIQAIKFVYEPHGMNMGMNHGASGGAGIPNHLHYHIVPRWNGDLNFFPLISETKLVIEDTSTSYKRLKKYFTDLKMKNKKKDNV